MVHGTLVQILCDNNDTSGTFQGACTHSGIYVENINTVNISCGRSSCYGFDLDAFGVESLSMGCNASSDNKCMEGASLYILDSTNIAIKATSRWALWAARIRIVSSDHDEYGQNSMSMNGSMMTLSCGPNNGCWGAYLYATNYSGGVVVDCGGGQACRLFDAYLPEEGSFTIIW